MGMTFPYDLAGSEHARYLRQSSDALARDLVNMQRNYCARNIPTHTTAPQGQRKREQQCDNCGAPLATNRCDYCGTNYS